MKCPKNGDVQEFLDELSTKCHKLSTVGITVTDIDYWRTILCAIPEFLSAYTSNTLTTLILMSEVTRNPVDMEKLLKNISDEANCLKICHMPRDQTQGQTKGKKGQTDKALAATSTPECGNNNSNRKHRKGKCHHCSREGHWVRKCHTKKKEEVAATANLSGQAAWAIAGNSSKPKNRPIGSANTAVIDNSTCSEFWMASTEADHTFNNPLMGESELSDNDKEDDPSAESEGKGEHSNWLDNEGEAWNIKGTAAAAITPQRRTLILGLTTLMKAVGNDKGFELEVTYVEQKV